MLSSRQLNKLSLVAGAALSASLLSMALTPQKAAAILNITFTETGGNVQLTLNGSLNVTGLTPLSPDSFSGNIISSQFGAVTINPNLPSATDSDSYSDALANPSNLSFGTGSDATNNSRSGSPFALLSANNVVFLPLGYITNQPLNSTALYNSATFASLGLTPGTYTSGFNSGANADSITINVQATPVPLESDAAPIVGAVAFMGVGVWWKRRRAQAKADLNFDNK